MLDPRRLRTYLRLFLLVLAQDDAIRIIENRSRAGRSLVDGEYGHAQLLVTYMVAKRRAFVMPLSSACSRLVSIAEISLGRTASE